MSELLKPFGKSILEAANHYRGHLEATTKSAPIVDLVELLLESKQTDGKSRRYLNDLRNRLRPFASEHGSRYASEFSAKDIHEWLAGIKVRKYGRRRDDDDPAQLADLNAWRDDLRRTCGLVAAIGLGMRCKARRKDHLNAIKHFYLVKAINMIYLF